MSFGAIRLQKWRRQAGIWARRSASIELTVAIHAVFDTPRDKLIWDVGHQAYAHKILTGRREAMAGLAPGRWPFRLHQTRRRVNTIHSGPHIPRPRFPQGSGLPLRARFGFGDG
jgi:hypothetical protein